MDDFLMEGALLRDTLDKLGTINKWLGGNSITIHGVKQLLKNKPKEITYRIVDLGCGHGDILRLIANFGRKKGYKLQLTGVDANQDTVDYAKELSVNYPEISFKKENVFSDSFKNSEYDMVLATLFLHHFKTEELKVLLKIIHQQAQIGIVVNDLHRNIIAYRLFSFLGLFISNDMIKEDGLTSILRAFKRKDLQDITKTLKFNATITWKWAFRYQWIIKK